jgi:hypothetical protein
LRLARQIGHPAFGLRKIKASGLLKAAGLEPLQEPEDFQEPEAQELETQNPKAQKLEILEPETQEPEAQAASRNLHRMLPQSKKTRLV